MHKVVAQHFLDMRSFSFSFPVQITELPRYQLFKCMYQYTHTAFLLTLKKLSLVQLRNHQVLRQNWSTRNPFPCDTDRGKRQARPGNQVMPAGP